MPMEFAVIAAKLPSNAANAVISIMIDWMRFYALNAAIVQVVDFM